MLDVLTYLFYLLSKPNIPSLVLRDYGKALNKNATAKVLLFGDLCKFLCRNLYK